MYNTKQSYNESLCFLKKQILDGENAASNSDSDEDDDEVSC